jgi:hypothetical protein
MKNRAVLLLFVATLLLTSWMPALEAQNVTAVHKPVVSYFNVAPAGILPNQVAILTLSVSAAKTVTVKASPCTPPNCVVNYGYAAGTFFVSPSVTSTYTLKATNSGGTVWAAQKVVVGKYINNPLPVPAGLKVTWHAACWHEKNGSKYQAMPFDAQISTPPGGLPIEATLYWGSTTCNGADGTDNLNDLGYVVHGGGLFWFTNFSNVAGSSVIWTLGNQSSGCVSYQRAPKCN